MESAIGLSTMIAIGPDNFGQLLAGSHAMDEHFRTAPLAQNLPVLLGLLCVWYGDFFDAQSVGVMPYDQYLRRNFWQAKVMGRRARLDSPAICSSATECI